MPEIYVLPRWTKNLKERFPQAVVIDTTSSGGEFRQLSPFVLGPCLTYVPGLMAQNFENLWQYSKVYKEHVMLAGADMTQAAPSGEWYNWRNEGWTNPRAVRYPMGKGAKPEFSWWNGRKLTYVQARKDIYAIQYFANVINTDSYSRLRVLSRTRDLVLLDYDAYDHRALGRTLVDVINDPNRKCGHAFILAMILTGVLPDCVGV
jgi:hypothetical protein